MKNTANSLKTSFVALCCASSPAANTEKPAVTVFKNVKVFNGTVVVKDSKVLKGIYSGQPIRNAI